MSFADDLAALPFHPQQQAATGFLPPAMRSLGHLLFVLAATAQETDTGTPVLTDEELRGELEHALEHWDATNANGAVSAAAIAHITRFRDLLGSTLDEWPDWDRETRLRNVREAAHRGIGIAAFLDRELLGITASDPGFQL